jgi:cobalamin biosynthesis Co2+ chelatase CbiK
MEIKLTVTQEKREETIDNILKLIESEYQEVEVTAIFAKKLLEEAIRALENRCLDAPLRVINKG